jgi:hypothetical protein
MGRGHDIVLGVAENHVMFSILGDSNDAGTSEGVRECGCFDKQGLTAVWVQSDGSGAFGMVGFEAIEAFVDKIDFELAHTSGGY